MSGSEVAQARMIDTESRSDTNWQPDRKVKCLKAKNVLYKESCEG